LLAEHFCRKNSGKKFSQNLVAIEESIQKSIVSKKKRSSEKKKLILLVKKRRNSVIVKAKLMRIFLLVKVFLKWKRILRKKRIKKVLKIIQRKQKKKKHNFQKFRSSEGKSVKFSPKTKVTLFFLSLF
jgi:hypothetical protein